MTPEEEQELATDPVYAEWIASLEKDEARPEPKEE